MDLQVQSTLLCPLVIYVHSWMLLSCAYEECVLSYFYYFELYIYHISVLLQFIIYICSSSVGTLQSTY